MKQIMWTMIGTIGGPGMIKEEVIMEDQIHRGAIIDLIQETTEVIIEVTVEEMKVEVRLEEGTQVGTKEVIQKSLRSSKTGIITRIGRRLQMGQWSLQRRCREEVEKEITQKKMTAQDSRIGMEDTETRLQMGQCLTEAQAEADQVQQED